MNYNIYWNKKKIAEVRGDEYFPDKRAINESMGLLKPLVLTRNGKIPKYILNRIQIDPECKNLCQLNTDKLTIEKVS